MKRITAVLSILVLMLLIVSVSGCTNYDKIADIQAQTSQYEGKEVNVKGYVGNTNWISFLDRGGYEVGDGSGTIWVISNTPPPQKGIEILVKGTVTTAFKLGNFTFGTVITETKRN
jgi:hypothetical protein